MQKNINLVNLKYEKANSLVEQYKLELSAKEAIN